MATVFFKLNYVDNNGEAYDITDTMLLDSKRGLQIKDAKTQITLLNSRYRYKSGGVSIFQEDGSFELYVDYDEITEANDQLLITGQIQEITHGLGEGGTTTKLSVSDRTNLLLGGVWGFTYENQSVDSIVRSVVNNAPSAQNTVTTNNVATSTSTGGSFPLVDMAKVMKPIYEWLSDLSQPGITGENKAYLFYVDKDNDLHWFYPDSTVSDTITEGVEEIYSISMKRSQDAMVNMIIYNAGADLRGNGIGFYRQDLTSKSNKLRMKYQPMIDIGRDLFYKETVAGNLTESSTGQFTYQGKLYSATFPLTPNWVGATSVADADDYNDAFREEAKRIANDRSDAMMKAFSGLRWNGTIELKGTHAFVAGILVTCTLPTFGITENLRVWDVHHNIGKDGWTTSVELREDDEALTSE